MAQIEKRSTGIRTLALMIGGFAVLIVAITVFTHLGGPASEEPPPQAPVAPSVAAEAVAEAEHAPRKAPPAPSEPPPAPALPAALPPAPESPPKKVFTDECTDSLFKAANPRLVAILADSTDRNQSDGVREFSQRRLARAGKACACIEAVYQRVGITDLSGEDARSTYEDVFRRHGREPPHEIEQLFAHCEHRAN